MLSLEKCTKNKRSKQCNNLFYVAEHTFAGCPTFTCYLCSAVFTAAHGLQSHMLEHGPAARPYDCPHCTQRFFFRAELDNHSFIHLDEEKEEARRKVCQRYRYIVSVSTELHSFSNVLILKNKKSSPVKCLAANKIQTKLKKTIP